MASRFDYSGKVTVNANKKKKRTLDRPKERPVGPPKKLVQEQPRTRTYLPNPGQASMPSRAPRINTPKARPSMQGPPVASTRLSASVGPRSAQAATPTRTGTGTGRPRVQVSISNETAIGRGLNRILTGSPNRTVEERRKRWQGIQSRAGN